MILRQRQITETKSEPEVDWGRLLEKKSGDAVLEPKRTHWSVENKLHSVLDVQFGEDSSRIRADHSAGNVNALRQIACSTLRETPGLKGSFRSRQPECLLDEQALSRAAETMGSEPMPAA